MQRVDAKAAVVGESGQTAQVGGFARSSIHQNRPLRRFFPLRARGVSAGCTATPMTARLCLFARSVPACACDNRLHGSCV